MIFFFSWNKHRRSCLDFRSTTGTCRMSYNRPERVIQCLYRYYLANTQTYVFIQLLETSVSIV